MTKKYWTLAIQYDVDGEPCGPPPHIEDRITSMLRIMHEYGFGMTVQYGSAEASVLDAIDCGSEETNPRGFGKFDC